MKRLVHVYGITNLIGALSALEYENNLDYSNVTLLLFNPGFDSVKNDLTINLIRSLTANFGIDVKSVSVEESLDLSQNIDLALKGNIYDYVYYAHDVNINLEIFSDYLSNSCQYICYGDALGSVYLREEVLSKLSKTSSFYFRQITSFIKGNRIKKSLIPDLARLALPLDQSGNFIKKTKLEIIPKFLVEKVISKLSANIENRSFLNNTFPSKVLLLTENLAEGNFATRENEILIYVNLIRKSGTDRKNIILKPHPNETWSRVEMLQKVLGPQYTVQSIDDDYSYLPIEVLIQDFSFTEIISTQYPRLSLKYLYNLEVKCVNYKKLITQFVNPNAISSFLEADNFLDSALENLESWSENGILRVGKPSNK